jgi:transcriptional regulator with PAS, ATPase and Fis domain
MADKQHSDAAEGSSSKWLNTPGLSTAAEEFETLLNIHYSGKTKAPPLMIVGDRGVGKSLFLALFIDRYTRDNPGRNVVTRNIAAIPETLVESEVFGHVKGSFTGASSDKAGLVEKVDLLVLEEIGELPDYVQAKLLTFIEDGRYYRVGDTKEKQANANIQIIATTNRTREEFRADFYDRFFKFVVPPLYKRRLDVLYYLDFFSPGLLQELRPWEIMNLLAHYWPGNVREVERVAQELKWQQAIHKEHERVFQEIMQQRADHRHDSLADDMPITPLIDSTQTDFKWDLCHWFRQSLEMNGVDIKLLEKILNVFGLGIIGTNRRKPLKKIQGWPIEDADLRMIQKGMHVFESLFMVSSSINTNLFEAHKSGKFTLGVFHPFQFVHNPGPEHEKLVRSIIKYTSGYETDVSVPFPDVNADYLEFIRKTMHAAYDDPMSKATSGKAEKEKEKALTDMDEKTLLEKYYRLLLEKTHGSKSKAAKLAGIEISTFCKRLKKM